MADKCCSAKINPGEGRLLIHQYPSSVLREEGMKQLQQILAIAMLVPGTDFYQTEHTLITFFCPPEQAEYGDLVRKYFEELMEETLQK